MDRDGFGDDGEAETTALAVLVPAAPERFKKLYPIGGGDTRSAISDLQRYHR